MAEPKVYVICDSNCKYEGMTKEQILAAIANAIETGSVGECDTGFITTIRTINGAPLKFFAGEQYEYDALSESQKKNLFAIITNDTTLEGIKAAIESLQANVSALHGRCNSIIADVRSGTLVAGKAKNANNATQAEHATNARNLLSSSTTYTTVTMTCGSTANHNPSTVEFSLSRNKTFLVTATGGFGFKHANSFVMRVPHNETNELMYLDSPILFFEGRHAQFRLTVKTNSNACELRLYHLNGSVLENFELLSPLTLTIRFDLLIDHGEE